MRRSLPILATLLMWSGVASAHGLLIPTEKTLPPLAMLSHHVKVAIEDQVAVTSVEQTFRNHTDHALEATYVFPVPKGASVQRFSTWVDGKEVKGELVEADKARQIYTDIVRRTLDPGLLEYVGNDVIKLRVFPVPAKGDQKLAVKFTAVAGRDKNLVEYVYPLKADGKALQTLEKFSLEATIKSQHPVQNVYSPTHAITLKRTNDRELTVAFSRDQAFLDKDFQLFYSLGDKDVGVTALTHRPLSGEPGYVLLLVSPRVELPKGYSVPRDVVLVLDTSGSMRGPKMDQAKKALRYCLDHLDTNDRFGVINFATTVNTYRDNLSPVNAEQLDAARKWVDGLEATGGTAIDDALATALKMRSKDESRSFTMVFFTDGQPTIGETSPEKILKNFAGRNTANTRVFTFGVGDDVNATMLDSLSDQTRAVSTYVRPAEDIEVKASGLYDKISHPVLANLKLSVEGEAVRLSEMYSPRLPDLFHGGQLVVLARYTGKGHAAVKLTGAVGKETKEYVYELNFPEKTESDHEFVEQLWARRKVGFMLDQIRANGEKKELVEEVVMLAKKYGIATPYTSYLVVPDGPTAPIVRPDPTNPVRPALPKPFVFKNPPGFRNPQVAPNAPAKPLNEFLNKVDAKRPADWARQRGIAADEEFDDRGKGEGKEQESFRAAKDKKAAYGAAMQALANADRDGVQTGKLGVDLSVQTNNLRTQSRLERTAQRIVSGRTCLDVGGVWIDEGFHSKMKTITVKAMSQAYFDLLKAHPELKQVFGLGNYLVWVTPSGTALLVDVTDGKETLSAAEIAQLFTAAKK